MCLLQQLFYNSGMLCLMLRKIFTPLKQIETCQMTLVFIIEWPVRMSFVADDEKIQC